MVIRILYGVRKVNNTIYGSVPTKALRSNFTDIVNQIYKLLPLKEDNDPELNHHFSTILFRIRGMSTLFPRESRWITVLALLEAARYESDFRLYRKAVLDSCSIVRNLGEHSC